MQRVLGGDFYQLLLQPVEETASLQVVTFEEVPVVLVGMMTYWATAVTCQLSHMWGILEW